MPEENTTQFVGESTNTTSLPPLTPVAGLIEQSLNNFKRLFSNLFPWLVLSCLGGFMAALAHSAIPLWQQMIIAVVGVIILFVSYVAEIRIISGIEREPNDIINNGRVSSKLLFPYIWIFILEIFIFLSGGLFVVPAIIFAVYLMVLPFVFVVEGARGFQALVRAWGYIAGRWWASFWRLAVAIFLLLIVTFVLNLILFLAFGSGALQSNRLWGVLLIQQLVEAFLIMPWMLCYLFEFYQNVRTTKAQPTSAEEKTAYLWLAIFLILGIILALLFAFSAVAHSAIHTMSVATFGQGLQKPYW